MTQSTDRTMLGVGFMVAFAIVAPLMDAFAKATPAEIPVAQVLLARFGIQSLLLAPLALGMGILTRPTRHEALLHLARGGALLAATAFFVASLRAMPIANAIAIFFVAPFFVTLAGGLFLGESIGPRRVIACLVGFGGALLVIRPSFDALGLAAFFPLGTAAFFTAYMLLTRTMSRRMHPVTLQTHTALAATLTIGPVLWVFDGSGVALLDPVWPQGVAVWTLLGVGVIATISHLFISYALRFAPAATLAPLQYLEIVGATAIGYVAFGEFPQMLTWLGIAIIVGSGMYVIARERTLGRTPPPPPNPAP
ncbi:DMT family transporter [Mesobacterium sp. TK19101]|uniref:DMT family transporter n=1 Tax=Mesobacterium hydrothermale TaxID=3111907 RepID=A0ABU6HK15_9RHOB|nr:DMT family transporter [Mesobacterium sp. TK19101]MEC3862251.1 DMT family transporter [Mesobacterium sp. TK19101]